MKSRISLFVLWVSMFLQATHAQESLDKLIEQELPALVTTYKTLHAAPELSGHEGKTSAFLAKGLRALGYTVTERVGKYDDSNLVCYGVAAIMKNGNGPTILVRADMDALPVDERTGLPYASKVRTKNDQGLDVGVMHACGHDIHVTSLLGTAKVLAQLKDSWHGTLVLIGQPAEELGTGADAMLRDELYTRFPRPDYILALHGLASLGTGKIGYCPGYALANVNSVDITIRGVGGHGSQPQSTKDPIVVAAQVVLALQTIVSRENNPLDPAVVTVGSIHGGTKHNIIPDDVKLQLTVRSYKEEVRERIIASIERITKGIAAAAGIPQDRAPIVEVDKTMSKATYNDPGLTERLAKVWEYALGKENVVKLDPMMFGEDVGVFSLEGHQIPLCNFFVGAVDPAVVAKSKSEGIMLPSLHSSTFAPLPEPTLRTGVKAMTTAVLDLMKK